MIALAALSSFAPISALGQEPSDDGSPPPDFEAPFLEETDEIIHSWALAPATSDDGGSRPTLTYTADPGSVIDDAVTLFNFSNVPLTFRVYSTDAFNSDDGGFALLSGDEAPTEAGSWVELPQEFIQIGPGEQATMPIIITIPDDVVSGDHVGAILASSAGVGTDGGGGVIEVERRTGTRMLIRVNGPLRPQLSIEALTTDLRTSANPLGGKATVTYRIENTGNVSLGGSTRSSIAGPFGIAEQQSVPSGFPELFPGQGITITQEFNDVPALGVAVTRASVDPTDDSTGGQAPAASKQSLILAIPFSILLMLLAAILGVLGIRAYRRHRAADQTAPIEATPAERESVHT